MPAAFRSLEQAGFAAQSIRTKARVYIEKSGTGFVIPQIELDTVAEVPGIDASRFQQEGRGCEARSPRVSRALAGPAITLTARLAGT